MKKILFVCSGNTCRSPLAEVIAKQVLPARVDFPLVIASAGTSALEGSPASRYSIEVAEAHGLDLSQHRAHLLDPARVRDADLIVTMGMRHIDTVGALDPAAREYAFLLTNFSEHHDGDIPDPIGGPMDVYVRTYGVIRECIESMAEQLGRFDGWKPESKERRKDS
ncbi:MAG TPA: low molecular weight protein arginine phosphatase [Candidatus Krumholzibacteria bacterium]|nr:low molecular weight protein arginine phosphatase [Candidatus Krumholzibacteria bacterium]